MKRQLGASRIFAAIVLLTALSLARAAQCPGHVLPATMQAVRLHEYGGPDKLKLESAPTPRAGKGEVLVRVKYASVNPVDWKLREGHGGEWWPLKFPAVLGLDVAGEIVQVGEGVEGLACGDLVSGYLGRTPDAARDRGGYAEYVAVDARGTVRKPANIDEQQAAAFPLVGVTAWAALVDLGALQQGERVLIHGGAGGVGSMAVQIAKARGAYVIATASARNHDFVASLGADEVIDYRSVKFEEAVKDVDLVLDTVGADTTARSPQVLRDGGRLVSIAGMPPPECGKRIQCPQDGGDPDGGRHALQALAKLIEAGKLKINVDEVFSLGQAGAAQERNREGHTRGKIVIQVVR
jgi:NADPH:quinone reductase-like Zn-dependent oxidoreductase